MEAMVVEVGEVTVEDANVAAFKVGPSSLAWSHKTRLLFLGRL
jgi:hypothetical protein